MDDQPGRGLRQEGEPFLDLIERVRAASKAVQRGEGDGGAIHELGRMGLPDAIRLVRAFNSYFHLANLAEQVHRFDGVATIDHLSNGRVNVRVGSGWMPEEFAAASAAHIFPERHKHARETIEIMQGIWTNDLFEYHGEFADFERCGFGAKPVQKPHPPIFFSGLKDPKRSASRIAKYGLSGWIGIQDAPDDLKQWRGAIQREFEELGSSRSINDLEICSMIWFVITDEETDQTPRGKASNLMVGTAAQITENLKRYQEAGLTMPLIWPPFQDVPIAKTLDDLKRLKEEIMPKVDAM